MPERYLTPHAAQEAASVICAAGPVEGKPYMCIHTGCAAQTVVPIFCYHNGGRMYHVCAEHLEDISRLKNPYGVIRLVDEPTQGG